MIITCDKGLRDFDFWAGAVQTARNLTTEELDRIEDEFMELYPEGMTDVQINDIFWFDSEWVYGLVGKNPDGSDPSEDDDEEDESESDSDEESESDSEDEDGSDSDKILN
jgi:hypothetical protein